MTSASPIALFAFNRPEHTAATLEALGNSVLSSNSELTIFCDGLRSPKDADAVAQVRAVAREAKGFKRLDVVERSGNLGLARSIISGVSQMLDSHDRVIVLEDDLVTSPHFLTFMNDGLQRYVDEDRVLSICGYRYPVPGSLPETFFLRGAHCWGWATWRRGWTLFEHDAEKLVAELVSRDLIYIFDILGSFPHTQMLQRVAAGEGESWAIRWMASAVLNDKLTLYPGISLVFNTGMDSSGNSAPATNVYDTTLSERPLQVGRTVVEGDRAALQLLRAFHIRWRRGWSRKERLYYQLSALLPPRVERALYSAIVRRSLRRLRLR